jgi:predicted nucleic acid-binding protein
MIVIDSSAWIEFYSPGGNTYISDLVEDAIRRDVAAVNGIILVEIAGFASQKDQKSIESDFFGFHTLEVTGDIFLEAVTICGKLRRAGFTIPATDAIIAATALSADAPLIHRDRHFEQITRYFSLQTMTIPHAAD